MKKNFILLILAVLSAISVLGQVGINTDNSTPDPSAMLDVKSSEKGLLPPRVALTATNISAPVSSPAIGLQVYNTATAGAVPFNVTPGIYSWDGSKWVAGDAPKGANVGDMQFWNGTQWVIVPAGTYGQQLFFCNGIPTWGGCPPVLTTAPVTNITYNSAVSGGNITLDGGTAVVARGVCWSTTPNPTINDSKTTDGSGTGSFVSIITGLSPITTYHLRSYATNSNLVTGYGNEEIFTTLCEFYPSVSVSIEASTNPVCEGSIVSIQATPTNGGLLPVYQWKVNGVSVGANNSVLMYTPTNNDTVQCIMTSSLPCTSTPAISNTIIIAVNPMLSVGVTITASANNVCQGDTVTFTATGINSGTIANYQWKLGGNIINGSTNSTYSYVPANNDVITCVFTSNPPCTLNNSATSNSIILTVVSPPAAPNAGTHLPSQTQIVWNWNPVPGATGYKWNTSNDSTTAQNMGSATSKAESSLTCNTTYSRYVWAYNGCGNSTATTLTQATTMNPAVGVSITASVNPMCSGTSVTFTATPVNGGTSPAYQWKKNVTVVVGATNSTYSFIPASNDSIRCQLTSSTACSQNNPALSNSITMTVNPVPISPTSGTHTSTQTQIIWNWNAVSGMAGYKWNTTNDITSATDMGTATTKTETGLMCNTAYTRYVWAYNACGNSTVTIFSYATASCGTFACGQNIALNHIAGSVSPVTKTTTYGTVTNIPGELAKCWITNNLGSDHQATAVSDATEASAGWYWQFNRKQGYKHDGTNRTPNTTWINNINESSDWISANDPCNVELGNSWRIPTYTEWNNVYSAGNWTNWNGPWNSGLKLHAAGTLPGENGTLYGRGIQGDRWSSTQISNTIGWHLGFNVTSCYMGTETIKSFGFNLRCIKNCDPPSTPTTGTHLPAQTQITWNWNTVSGATGYKWNTTNNYSTAINMGTSTSKTETGLTCNMAYTRYAWAYNACGNSTPVTLNLTTSACPAPCPGIPSVTYGGQTYNTVQIGTQCWLKENLNVGTRINVTMEQTNNSVIEKYCYNDLESNCDIYGGLYQWNEMMQYITTAGAQGICPSGWHIPTDAQWTTVTTSLGGESVAGGKMKTTGTIQAGTGLWYFPNTGATNESGFSAIPAGDRTASGAFYGIGNDGVWWSSTQYVTSIAWLRNVIYHSGYVYRDYNDKSIGFSVRCLRDY